MTAPYYADDAVTVHHGDCLDVLRQMPDNSVDAVVTDPPAGISFMSKSWDGNKGGREQWSAWLAEIMAEALRVTKPGGHALVWALPRTAHWTACGLEDAGWEIRDRVVHLFGTGFPKSLDVSRAIDKAAGAERAVVGRSRRHGGGVSDRYRQDEWTRENAATMGMFETAPATPAARQWQGWGTALKPAAEDWWLCRKPLSGTVAANVLAHGTGALNVDACRVHNGPSSGGSVSGGTAFGQASGWNAHNNRPTKIDRSMIAGRWPTNVVLDGDQADALDAGKPVTASQGGSRGTGAAGHEGGALKAQPDVKPGLGDAGGPSRFFPVFRYQAKAPTRERPKVNGIAHPTCKPANLMRWLCRLVTPPGGVVLDPFAGSGTTIEAAILEGFRCVAVEREADYLPLIDARIARARAAEPPPGDVPLFEEPAKPGRWPTNVVMDRGQAADLDAGQPASKDGVAVNRNRSGMRPHTVYGEARVPTEDVGYGGEGGPSRFFPVFEHEPLTLWGDDEDGVA